MEKPEGAMDRFRTLGTRAGEMIQAARQWAEPSERVKSLRQAEHAELRANDAESDYHRSICLIDAGEAFIDAGQPDRAAESLSEAIEFLESQYRTKGFESLMVDLTRAYETRVRGLIVGLKPSEALDLANEAKEQYGIDLTSVRDNGAL